MNTIQSGVEARNRIVHGRGGALGTDQLRALLLAIKDLLYLFDYYAGYEWALDLISREVRVELGVNI
jgi:hypothetical protein